LQLSSDSVLQIFILFKFVKIYTLRISLVFIFLKFPRNKKTKLSQPLKIEFDDFRFAASNEDRFNHWFETELAYYANVALPDKKGD
jgi:hypothetical protein